MVKFNFLGVHIKGIFCAISIHQHSGGGGGGGGGTFIEAGAFIEVFMVLFSYLFLN